MTELRHLIIRDVPHLNTMMIGTLFACAVENLGIQVYIDFDSAIDIVESAHNHQEERVVTAYGIMNDEIILTVFTHMGDGRYLSADSPIMKRVNGHLVAIDEDS